MALSARVVGRDVELTELHEAMDAAERGQGSVLFLVGEAGIGKSRLAQSRTTPTTGVYWYCEGGQCRREPRFRIVAR